MSDLPGAWVHLQLSEDFYATFEIPALPMPIRTGFLFEFSEGKRPLSTELLASELVAYVEERPEERDKYRAALAELAMSVGTAAGKAGDHSSAVMWLERSVEARGDDPRVLVNLAVALVGSGRPRDALYICERVRKLRPVSGMSLALIPLEAECRRAIEGEAGQAPVN